MSYSASGDTGVSEKLTAQPSREAHVDPPFKKVHFREGTDRSMSDIMSQSENPGGISTRRRKFLSFEERLSSSDFESNKLTIPWETVKKYFLPDDTGTHLKEIKIVFSNKSEFDWHMKISIVPLPGGQFVIPGWSYFFATHKLQAWDLIRFYKPLQPLHNKQHYLLDCLKYLFKKKLTATDVSQKLILSIGVVEHEENHFPRLITSEPSSDMLHVSDAQNKNWEMEFQVSPVATEAKPKYGYTITWTKFVNRHQLEKGDVIYFYKPVPPSNDNRYAIRFAKAHKGGRRLIATREGGG